MKRQLYHIEPIYKSFIWGGRALIDHFHIKTDMENKRSCRAADIRWCDSSFSNFIKTSCAISTVYTNGL